MAPPRKPDQELSKWGAYNRAQAQYTVLGLCAMCGLVPAQVRHHHDRTPVNNAPENVVFLCRACHAKLHMTTTHCLRGHEWVPETTYITPTGQRQCLLCRRLRQQQNADANNARRRAKRASPRPKGPYKKRRVPSET